MRLQGEVCTKCDEKIFPPTGKHVCKTVWVYDSRLLFPPDDKGVHGEVVRKDKEEDDKG